MDSLAVFFPEPNKVDVCRQQVPELKPGHLLVRTRKTLISAGTETGALTRNFEEGSHPSTWIRHPFYPGYSNVGDVVAVGEGVKHIEVGNRVACRGGHAQYVLVTPERTCVVPDGVSDEDATWHALACIVQNGVRRANHELGDAVAVIGLGQLGQLAVQYARLFGARAVIGIDTVEPRREMAKAHGATDVLADAGDIEAVQGLTYGRGADVVYEITGHPAVLPQALRLAKRFGTLVLLGTAGFPSQQHIAADLVTRGLKLVGAHDSNPPATPTDHAYWTHPKMARLFFTYLLQGRMRVNDLITHRFRPEQAAEAYDVLLTRRASAMGVLFDWAGVG